MAENLLTKYLGHLFGHVSEHAIVMDDDSLFASIELDGVPLSTGPNANINGWRDSLNTTWSTIGLPDRLTLSVYDMRGLALPSAVPPGIHRTAQASAFDAAYRDRLFREGLLWENRLVLGIHVSPRQPLGQSAAAKVRKLRRMRGKQPQASDELLHDLESVCARLMVELAPAGPRRLGMVERDGSLYCEQKEFLAYALTNVRRQVPVTTGRVGGDILSEHVTVGHETVTIRGPGHRRYVACLGVLRWPVGSNPLRARVFQSSTYPRTIVCTFSPMNDGAAMGLTTRKQNVMVSAADPAYEQIDQLTQARNDLQSKKFTFGASSFVMTVFAEDRLALERVCDAGWHDIIRSGATAVRERDALIAGYFSMVMGRSSLQVRPGAVTSRNFASLAPLHGHDGGAPVGHWGRPIAVFRSSVGTPVLFHLHVMDVGNVLLTGETGSGKTTLGGVIISNTIGRARIFAFDHKRGWEAVIRGNGGPYARLGAGKPQCAPLKARTGDLADVEFLLDLIRRCIRSGGWRELDAEEDRRLGIAVNVVMSLPPEDRSLGEIRAFLGASREGAGARLERWCAGNELGWVIDAPQDTITLDGNLFGFDTTHLLGNKAASAPILLYLFYQVRRRLDGTPTLLLIDEGWDALADPVFGPPIARELRTVRSKNGAIVFTTQSPSDVARSGLSASFVEQCPTQIHGANTRMSHDDFVAGLGRTEEEFAIVRSLPIQRGLFLLCRGRESQVIELNLTGMEDEIAMLSTREEDHEAIDQAVAEAGDDPAEFVRLYHAYRKANAAQKEEMAA